MKKIYLISVCWLLIVSCGSPKKKVVDEGPQRDIPKEQLQSFLLHHESVFKSNFGATEVPGAAIAIVKDDSIIYMKGFGLKEIGKPDSVDVNTVFRIGSLSKGFTSVMVSLLVNKGLLSWEDRVVDYVPNFKLQDTAQTRRIKLKHLLSHTTGLPKQSLIEMIEDGKTLDEMILQLRKLKVEGIEGITFNYQNVTYSIVQNIIEKKTNKRLEQWIKEEIFIKGGMKHASMSYEELMAEPNKSMPHIRHNDYDFVIREIHSNYYQTAAAGGVNASISDMAQWLLILMGNRPDISPTGSLDYIFTPYIYHDELSYFDTWTGVTKSAYGMGWRIWEFHGRKIISHGGSVNDYKTEIAFDPQSKIGVCFMFNAQNYYSRVAIPNFLEMYYMYEDLIED